jgi:DNA-binding transcriptional regulator YiaG
MSDKVKKAPAAKPAAAAKPPKKLVPRTAPKARPAPVSVAEGAVAAPKVVVAAAAVKPAAVKPAAAKPAARPAAAKPVRKATQVEATVAKHQKVLADALVKAKAIKYEQPKVETQEALKVAKPVKAKKVKLVRDSYAMPENEYAQINVLKKRLSALGNEAKKSELLRGGIATLAALSDVELKAVMGRVERIKTGRPAK